MIPRHTSNFDTTILARSRDRADGGSSSSFTVDFKEPLEGNHILRWVTIPNTIYNINSTNNQIYLLAHPNGGATATATTSIPKQNYTGAELATALQAALIAALSDADIRVQFNTNTLKLEIGMDFDAANYAIVQFQGGENSIHEVLGMDLSNNITDDAEPVLLFTSVSALAFVAFPNVIRLSSPISLSIRIKGSSSIGYTTGGKKVTGGKSYFNASGGTVLVPFIVAEGVYSFQSFDKHTQYVYFSQPTKNLTVTVVDPSTNTTAELNGADWEFCLEKTQLRGPKTGGHHLEQPRNKRARFVENLLV